MRAFGGLLCAGVLAVPALVHAEDIGAPVAHPVAAVPHATTTEPARSSRRAHDPASDAAPRTRERWYGWQTLAIDGASLLLLIASSAASDSKGDASEIMAGGAVGGYLLGSPITHFLHDSPARGIGSLALRAGLPIAFGYVGTTIEKCPPEADLCGLAGAILGGMLGIATAIAIDAAALGYEDVPIEPRTGLQNISVALGRERALLVAAGTF
jgi:hypothetical protein